jgi:hypothetical protein
MEGRSVLGHKCGEDWVDSLDTGQGSVGVLMNTEMKIQFAKGEGNLLNI